MKIIFFFNFFYSKNKNRQQLIICRELDLRRQPAANYSQNYFIIFEIITYIYIVYCK